MDLPALAAPHLLSENRAPGVHTDGHGTEVDIWSAGELIKVAKKTMRGFPSSVIRVGQRMNAGEWDQKIRMLRGQDF